jgi:hypothetical protein
MLVRLQLDQPAAAGSLLYQNAEKIGTLTSVALHPKGYTLGLGFVKSSAYNQGAVVQLEQGGNATLLEIAGTQPGRS